jgi:hypothetical protein
VALRSPAERGFLAPYSRTAPERSRAKDSCQNDHYPSPLNLATPLSARISLHTLYSERLEWSHFTPAPFAISSHRGSRRRCTAAEFAVRHKASETSIGDLKIIWSRILRRPQENSRLRVTALTEGGAAAAAGCIAVGDFLLQVQQQKAYLAGGFDAGERRRSESESPVPAI